jgi:hypothetical protein
VHAHTKGPEQLSDKRNGWWRHKPSPLHKPNLTPQQKQTNRQPTTQPATKNDKAPHQKRHTHTPQPKTNNPSRTFIVRSLPSGTCSRPMSIQFCTSPTCNGVMGVAHLFVFFLVLCDLEWICMSVSGGCWGGECEREICLCVERASVGLLRRRDDSAGFCSAERDGPIQGFL